MHTEGTTATSAAGRRTRAAWYVYDLGNTTVEFAIPLYLTLWIVSDLGIPAWVYGIASAISSWAIGLSGPYIGLIADETQRRKQWFVFSSLTSAVLLGSLSFLPHADTVAIAAVLVVAMAANYLFQLSSLVYNASLLGASQGANVVSVSSAGMGLSYLGGIAGIGVLWLMTTGRLIPGLSGRAVAIFPAAIIYLICAIPSMCTAGLWQPRAAGPRTRVHHLHHRIRDIWKQASAERQAGWFLAGYFALNSAVMGLTLYLPLHVETVTGLTDLNLMLVYGAAVVASAIGAGAVALLRPTGPMVRWIIVVGLALLALNAFAFSLARSIPLVTACACLHGLFSGSIVPACRGAFAWTFSSDHQALAFGLFGAVQRLSQGLGALLWPLAGAGGGSHSTSLGVAAMGVVALVGIPLFARWRFSTLDDSGPDPVSTGEQG